MRSTLDTHHPTPINCAEAIFEPFWDQCLSRAAGWTVKPGDDHGLRVYEHWGWLAFEWSRRPDDGPALRMSRAYALDCTGYDQLVLSLMAPEGSRCRISAATDRGNVTFEAPPAPSKKKEWAVNLDGASTIRRITIEIEAAGDGVATGWFNWLGLRNSAVLPGYLRRWQRFDAGWQGYLRPVDQEPSLTAPTGGLILTAEELARIRQRHDAFLAEHGTSPIVKAAEEARQVPPEDLIGEYVNFWDDTRFCRERDHDRVLLTHGGNAAFAGALLGDPGTLRLAARYAMALGMCGKWDDGPVGSFPGSTFELRGFVHSLCMVDVSIALDLAGEWFTDLGRDYLLRRIAEEGEGMINYASWRHEYMHHCNQIAWFSPGRLYGYLMLERDLPRVRPYTDLAMQDLVANVEETILPDGGYVEGPTYFFWVARCAALALHLYGRARDKTLAGLMPAAFARSAAFGAAIASTDDALDMIPICDAQKDLVRAQDGLAMLAARWPESQWTTLYRKTVARGGGFPHTPLACLLDEEIPVDGPPPPALTFLPDTGLLASVRRLGNETVKLLILGNQAGASHTHEDKGSFVLEFAGETFAMDPGSCDYSSPLSLDVKHAQRHCMLVPAGLAERPRPTNPIPASITPRGDGDDRRFSATIDATPGWESYYRRWVRTWDSPAPDLLSIRDDYELGHGGAVEFLWQTKRDVQVDGHRIVLTGHRGDVAITAPADTTIRVDELPLYGGAIQRRIAIRKTAPAGDLTVTVRFHPHS
ncbi:MAG: heparinase II/III domain-containing protein [Thermomicrobiales bacterium]